MVTDNKVSTTHSVFTPDLSKHGVKYQGLASANPYANVEYRQSWMQKFLERIGFRTNKDAYLESMALQAQEYDNALMQKEYDEKYNDPLAQAERERAAGLNPNLTGNVSSGEASPIQDDGNPPIAPEADDLSLVQNFATAALSGVQFAFGIAKDIQSLRSMKLDNLGKSDDFTMNALLNVIPEVYDSQSGIDWVNVPNYYNSFKKAYGNVMSKRQFERFVKRASAFQEGLAFRTKEFKTRNERATDRKSFFRSTSGDEDYSEVDDVMFDISKVLSNLSTKVFKRQSDVALKRADADEAKIANDITEENYVRPERYNREYEYLQNRSTKGQALAENMQDSAAARVAENNADMSDYQMLLRDSFKDIMGKLNERADKGNKFAVIAQAILSAILLNTIQLPSVGFKSKSGFSASF